jgi:hypothetical protein
MATTTRKRPIRQAERSVKGFQGQPERPPIARAGKPAPSTRLTTRAQPQAGPKLNELRGKIARMEKERSRMRDGALYELAQIETILGSLTMTSFSVVATAVAVAEIRMHCDTLRKVLG